MLSPTGRREIEALRAQEVIVAEMARQSQYRHNRLALIYARKVVIDYEMRGCPYRMLHPDRGWLRGREGMIPSRANMDLSIWREIAVTPACADALIKRDGDTA